jgi:hypothetical protein
MTRGESRPPRGPAHKPTTQTARTIVARARDHSCYLCESRPAVAGSDLCQVCLDATLDGLHRRQMVELRLPPLEAS